MIFKVPSTPNHSVTLILWVNLRLTLADDPWLCQKSTHSQRYIQRKSCSWLALLLGEQRTADSRRYFKMVTFAHYLLLNAPRSLSCRHREPTRSTRTRWARLTSAKARQQSSHLPTDPCWWGRTTTHPNHQTNKERPRSAAGSWTPQLEEKVARRVANKDGQRLIKASGACWCLNGLDNEWGKMHKMPQWLNVIASTHISF